MTGRTLPGAVWRRVRHPQTTVRWRLALLYGGLFLVSGAALLGITYALAERAPLRQPPGYVINGKQTMRSAGAGGTTRPPSARQPRIPPGQTGLSPRRTGVPPDVTAAAKLSQLPRPIQQALNSQAGQVAIRIVGSTQRVADLHQLIIESGVALAIMALISAGLGWLVAGRVLRPLRTITATTQQISEANLNERLALPGPERDELRQLADTIDGLLGRLETAFDAQRRFVANASHELRTPLTAARALLEMVLSDPHATVATFRTTCRQVLEESEQQEQLIDALLALAQGQRGIARRERLDLTAIVAGALRACAPDAAERGLTLDACLQPASLSGDRRLIERLVANLLDNARHYNVTGGRVRVEVADDHGEAWLRILNSGPVVPADQIERLLQPFQRLGAERVARHGGLGLGLSIVAAIAGAHNATLDVQPAPEGGLDVRLRFPPPLPGDLAAPQRALGEGRAGQERPQGPGVPAHA